LPILLPQTLPAMAELVSAMVPVDFFADQLLGAMNGVQYRRVNVFVFRGDANSTTWTHSHFDRAGFRRDRFVRVFREANLDRVDAIGEFANYQLKPLLRVFLQRRVFSVVQNVGGQRRHYFLLGSVCL